MVLDPIIIQKRHLQSANWNEINLAARAINPKEPNLILKMVSDFAKSHVGGDHSDGIIKRLSYHTDCKSGILIDSEQISFI